MLYIHGILIELFSASVKLGRISQFASSRTWVLLTIQKGCRNEPVKSPSLECRKAGKRLKGTSLIVPIERPELASLDSIFHVDGIRINLFFGKGLCAKDCSGRFHLEFQPLKHFGAADPIQ